MRRIVRALSPALLGATILALGAPSHVAVGPARAAQHPYSLETSATYDVQPDAGEVAVTVEVVFTNTTPDPPGRFSVFDELKLAIHDQAVDAAASDAEGDLAVTVAVESEVNVATIALREQLRFEESAELTLRYTLPDSDDPQLRVRPSLVTFPAWSFGTAGEVRVMVPDEYGVHVDGDALTEEAGALVSGPIADPSQWLALVTALGEPSYSIFEAAVPLSGGTADLEVRSFDDDEPWGERTLALVERALPLLEEEIGLPYPGVGALVLTEAVALKATGIGEETVTSGAEILIAFDEPPFTALHQVSHVWLSEALIATRWIREGMASEVAQRIAERVEVTPPYDPAAVATERADAAFALDTWSADAGAAGEAYGYAASWSVIAELRDRVGVEALRAVVARAASSVGPYQPADIAVGPPAENAPGPAAPLTSRSFLDHLETVSGMDVSDIFRSRVLDEADIGLLEARAAARAAFGELIGASDGWGAPEPVAGAMTAWSFDEALAQIEAARSFLSEREALLRDLERAGLSAPDRLQQAYRTHGGGADAQAELRAEREVAEAYISTADAVNAERSFVERVGLVGGPDPAQELRLANGRFAEGDLGGSLAAIREVQQLLASAEAAGFARLASAVLILVVLLVVAVVLFRRRGSYAPSR